MDGALGGIKTYSEHRQTTKMERFLSQPLNISEKRSILDLSPGS